MINRIVSRWLLTCFVVTGALLPAHAADTLVKTQDEYRAAVDAAKPGDRIVLADGQWQDFEIVFTGEGTADAPITLTAQSKGSVIISGRSNLRLGGKHLVVSGLTFRDGYTPTNEVIAFRNGSKQLAHHSRVTETVIDRFNNPERFETDFWVMLYGQNNRFDHNHLEGKSNAGVTMAVRLDSEDSQNNHHRIDHNYFGPREILGANGGETLRIGTSKYSLTNSHTVVENNYFDRCNGELEIISIKSGSNVVRGNVFFEARGTLTLRHGNDNLLENNVFFGNNMDHTGGLRVINKRQTVRNNYMYGLTGFRLGGGLVVMNGVPNSPINRYHQVEGAVIENNTIIDSDHVEFGAGSDEERSAVPIDSRFAKNLIVHSKELPVFAVHDDMSGITFAGNVVDGPTMLPNKTGFERAKIKLVADSNGLLHPAEKAYAGVGIGADLAVLDAAKTGVAWQPKAPHRGPFGYGKVTQIEPGEDTLTAAVAAAAPGDIIELSPGDYRVSQILNVDVPITVRGIKTGAERPVITFERSTLFEIGDGGGLSLARLHVDGTVAPDAYGNSVVRTGRYSMLRNYELHLDDSIVTNLNTNHSFHFLKVASHTFAQRISISGSTFENVTGHILNLDREIDDLGIYNAEYVDITDSNFAHVGGTIGNIYRGGTDESTFGPHVTISGSVFKDVGGNKRNKTKASIYLLGVQATHIHGNEFVDSQPITVVETVGDPVTNIEDNKLKSTPPAVITQLAR
ncbi:MAG: polysaccharide lyase 6 family protein [Gammaproteobacteria bacterium]